MSKLNEKKEKNTNQYSALSTFENSIQKNLNQIDESDSSRNFEDLENSKDSNFPKENKISYGKNFAFLFKNEEPYILISHNCKRNYIL